MTLLDTSPQDTQEPVRSPSAARHWRALGLAALCPLVAGYAVIAALLALVSALASNAPFATADVLLAAGPGWLAATLVPLWIDGAPLGVTPLLLTGFLLLLAERSAAAAADRLGPDRPGAAWPIVATVAGAHAVFGATIAVLCGNGPVTAHPALAFLCCAALAGIAAALGVRDGYGLRAALRSRIDDAAALGIGTGLRVLFGFCAAGALLYLVSLLATLSTAGDLLAAAAPGVGDGAGVVLLGLGYLPNLVIGATAFLLGPGFAIGAAEFGPFALSAGAVPGLPMLAGLPEQAAGWWPLLCLVMLAVGAAAGRRVRRTPLLVDRMRAVALAGLVAGSGCLVLAALASGQLGSGAFTPVLVPAGQLAAAGFVAVVLPGALVAAPGAALRKPVTAQPETSDPEAPESEAPESEAPESEDLGLEDLDPENVASEGREPVDAEDPAQEQDNPEQDTQELELAQDLPAQQDFGGAPPAEEFPPDELGPPKGRTAAERG